MFRLLLAVAGRRRGSTGGFSPPGELLGVSHPACLAIPTGTPHPRYKNDGLSCKALRSSASSRGWGPVAGAGSTGFGLSMDGLQSFVAYGTDTIFVNQGMSSLRCCAMAGSDAEAASGAARREPTSTVGRALAASLRWTAACSRRSASARHASATAARSRAARHS